MSTLYTYFRSFGERETMNHSILIYRFALGK